MELKSKSDIAANQAHNSSWREYRNTKYNYGFKYPKSVTVNWGKEAQSGLETEEEKNPTTTNILAIVVPNDFQLLIQVYVSESDKTLNQIYETANYNREAPKYKVIKINNNPALVSLLDREYEDYILVNNGIKYEIYVSSQDQELAKQILSTFVFFDETN